MADLRLSPDEASADETEAEREQAVSQREAFARAEPHGSAPPPSSRLGEQLARALTPSARTLAMLGTFLIGLGAVLYLARIVFIPLTFALMLSFLLSPAVTWLERQRLPRSVGAALIVLALLGAGGFAGVQLATPAADWIARSPGVLQTLERKVRPWRRPVKNVSELAQRVERITQVDERKAPTEVTLEKPSILSHALDTVWAVAAGCLVTLFALYFTLLTGEVLLARVIAWVPDLNQRRTAEVIVSIQQGMSRYLRTVFGINAVLGLAVALALYVLGMPNPFLWGALALLVNFVPYVGPFVGILTVGAVSLASFEDTTRSLLPPLVYLAIASVEGNVITPLILGRTCELDPLVIFVWLLLWGWLWGIAGAIVAVPLLMLIKLMCERSQVLGPVAALISRGTPAAV
ncbi:MAG TPA: AI-2E family transporter [Polyangiaceae bacterium]|nr:AI-2E family transporter [Polyangiaceae bacterium]